MAVLGLRLCARAFPSRGKRGPLFIAVRGPLTIAASPVAEHRLQTRRLSNCGSRAQPLRGTRDPPRPGPEPVPPALAGRLSTTAPPGKPSANFCTDRFDKILKVLFVKKFTYFWLSWVFVAACRLSLVEASGGYCSLQCTGFLLWWLLLLRSTGSRCMGFSSCGTRASVVVARGL